jgi:hypothetical protein
MERSMKRLSAFVLPGACSLAFAQQPAIYLALGQIPLKQQQDEGACMQGRGYTVQ